MAVAPDQAETLASIHLKTDVGKQFAREIGFGKLVNLNHGALFQ
jgi:hypothetical protein